MDYNDLKKLNVELWPTTDEFRYIDDKDRPKLTTRQLKDVLDSSKKLGCLYDIVAIGGFGQIGLKVMKCPDFVGAQAVDCEDVLLIGQHNLPLKGFPQSHKPTGGSPPKDAWDLFMLFVDTEENLRVLKYFGYPAPRTNRMDYAY